MTYLVNNHHYTNLPGQRNQVRYAFMVQVQRWQYKQNSDLYQLYENMISKMIRLYGTLLGKYGSCHIKNQIAWHVIVKKLCSCPLLAIPW